MFFLHCFAVYIMRMRIKREFLPLPFHEEKSERVSGELYEHNLKIVALVLRDNIGFEAYLRFIVQ